MAHRKRAADYCGRVGGYGTESLTLSGKAEIPPPPSLGMSVPPPRAKPTLMPQQLQGQAMAAKLYPEVRWKPCGYSANAGYLDDDNDEKFYEEEAGNINDDSGLPYQKASDSESEENADADDDDDDPLDAYMAQIEGQVAKQTKKEPLKSKKLKGTRDDIETEDVQESYFRFMAENPTAGLLGDDDVPEVDYDEDGNPIAPEKSRYIDPLPKIDHSEINYEPFEKNFYVEHSEITCLTSEEVNSLRNKLGIKVSGACPAKPACSFSHFTFDTKLMGSIRKSEYTQPTPIQAQGIPIALAGRDIIGIAKTGSGKTCAYLWPLLVHIMDQRNLEDGEGPIGLIVAPTRELSHQIYAEVKKFGKVYNIHAVCAYGGGSKYEQTKACQEGAEIIICTPGRLIDLVKCNATSLQRVTFLVFDEADRMFDMGFEPQVRSIADHVRPDRQTLLFSATFRRKVEKLARDILTDPVRVIQGELGEANEDVTQVVEILSDQSLKLDWLSKRIVGFTSSGSVLVFVTKKLNCEELAKNLKLKDFDLEMLHGDMNQYERNDIISKFRKKEVPVLIATDVAARGLDIPSIRTVVNYDVARDIDTHTHRIGRTGRAGEKGMAFTLVTSKDVQFAGDLVRNLEGANQTVPDQLMSLAMQNSRFKKSRFKEGKGKMMKNLGTKERPGIGAASASVTQDSFSTVGFRFSAGQTNRLATMKAAFASQFKTNFKAADDRSDEQNHLKAGGVYFRPGSERTYEREPPQQQQQQQQQPQPQQQQQPPHRQQGEGSGVDRRSSRWDTNNRESSSRYSDRDQSYSNDGGRGDKGRNQGDRTNSSERSRSDRDRRGDDDRERRGGRDSSRRSYDRDRTSRDSTTSRHSSDDYSRDTRRETDRGHAESFKMPSAPPVKSSRTENSSRGVEFHPPGPPSFTPPQQHGGTTRGYSPPPTQTGPRITPHLPPTTLSHSPHRYPPPPSPSNQSMAFPQSPSNQSTAYPLLPSNHSMAFPPPSNYRPSFTPPSNQRPAYLPPPTNQSTAYPLPSNQSMAYSIPSNQSTAYPIPSNQSTAYPIPSNQSTTYPISSNQSTAYPFSSNQSTAYPIPSNQSTAYPIPSNQSTAYPIPANQSTAYPLPSNQSTAYPLPGNQGTMYPPGGDTSQSSGERKRRSRWDS